MEAPLAVFYFGRRKPAWPVTEKITGATRRVLNVQLNQMEKHGLISRQIYAELPPRVEYKLTPLGLTVLPIITALGQWGDTHQKYLRRLIAQSQE
jgi:DNA-binding HxlR family transcriptional regulator